MMSDAIRWYDQNISDASGGAIALADEANVTDDPDN
jgi:hypothetical protein